MLDLEIRRLRTANYWRFAALIAVNTVKHDILWRIGLWAFRGEKDWFRRRTSFVVNTTSRTTFVRGAAPPTYGYFRDQVHQQHQQKDALAFINLPRRCFQATREEALLHGLRARIVFLCWATKASTEIPTLVS